MTTIEIIAKKAGVSRGTVDRVLHDRGQVKPETAERVRAVMEEMDGLLPQADVVALMLAVGEKIRPCDEAGTYILKKEEA